jgi:FAD/FMN-containing dehydrogenase
MHADLGELRQMLSGALHLPADEGWEEGRTLFNSMIDRRPAAIARVADTDDIAMCLAWARRTGTEVAVRAGGHSVAGASLNDGGLVLDVRSLDSIHVDPVSRTARVGSGLTWAQVDAATQEHGLATTGGRVSTTGVAGLTLGGGSGWLERSYGLSCDNLIGATLVSAAGQVVRASEDEDPELLWALRGGGGNFGVVTELEFRLHPVGPLVFGGLVAYDPVHGATVARAFRDFIAAGDVDEAGLAIAYLTAPPEEFVPTEWHGRAIMGIAGCWNGPPEDGERTLRPLLECAEPIVDLFGPIPYAALQSLIDDPPGYRNWWTAEYLEELTDDAIDAFVHYANEMPLSFTQCLLVPWGGEVARRSDSPLAKRDAAYVLHPFCVWEGADRDEEHIAWGRACRAVFEQWTSGGVYLNFVGDEGEERVRAAFGAAYERLAAVKERLDPENVFRGNQNIRPRGQLIA